MSQIKEVIEDLTKNVYFWDNEGSGRIAQIPRDDYDQALAKLRTEQPPAGKFTRKMREEHKEVYLHRPCQYTTDIYDLCAIIDRSKASRKDLLTALEELAATFVGLPEGSIGGQAMKKANDAINKEISGKK